MKFLPWPHEPGKDPEASRRFSCSHPIEEWFLFLLYHDVALYRVHQDFGRSAQVSTKARKKNKSKTSNWGEGAWKCLHFCHNESLIQSFLYEFRQRLGSCPQWRGVRNSAVSAGRESIVYNKPHTQTENLSLITQFSLYWPCTDQTNESASYVAAWRYTGSDRSTLAYSWTMESPSI